MENKNKDIIIFSHEKKKKFATEQIALHHSLSYIVSGRMTLQFSDKKLEFEAGDVLIVRKNELMKAVKYPAENGESFRCVNVYLTDEILQKYSAQKRIAKQEKYTGNAVLNLSKNKFISGYFASILPYFYQPEKLNATLTDLKSQEAIELLLDISHNFEQFLFDAPDPYKLDLEKFMNTNFQFNIPLSEFARLTGRSLSTYQRDFKKLFETSPEKWLKDKRLTEANYLITEKKQKPSEVYHNVGFENFSHFTTAFKQKFGHTTTHK
ncbi:helix-turn-helix domain-containing protein [Flavobacterium sp. MC2016-06]|uniref:AraC family transcriptional regulator n=1 Tax=Flavobacterium sp. MC2016-06 TaxID=2676308 RepID=UPI0012BAC026|nr:AraC family transcriptional regulator [Flavobacterium sp. MC2016-06]MBU3858508.1 AraC family transcriptional regulator [Flavobacterium sp. MC2016-06]